MGEIAQRYFIVNKPADMVSQFVSTHAVRLLGDIDFNFPEGTHTIGRLDSQSEGLLILTTNKKVTRLLFQASVPHKRVYLVLVKNVVGEETLNHLRTGVTIKIKGGVNYVTACCEAEIISHPKSICKQATELALSIPHTWLLITITEGKFHQVRKMVSAVRHKCKRLIRVAIEELTLGNLQPGAVKEITEHDFFLLLKIDNWSS